MGWVWSRSRPSVEITVDDRGETTRSVNREDFLTDNMVVCVQRASPCLPQFNNHNFLQLYFFTLMIVTIPSEVRDIMGDEHKGEGMFVLFIIAGTVNLVSRDGNKKKKKKKI